MNINIIIGDADATLMNKPLTIKGCCRVRENSQHDERRIVRNLCLTKWNEFQIGVLY